MHPTPPARTMANPRSRDVAVRVRGGVAALEPYLVRPLIGIELDEEVGVYRDAPIQVHVSLGDPAADAIWVELCIPGGIQRVAEVHPAPVAAQLHHLRPAVQRASRAGVRHLANYASQMHRASLSGVERVGDV